MIALTRYVNLEDQKCQFAAQKFFPKEVAQNRPPPLPASKLPQHQEYFQSKFSGTGPR
jgi:hypothetical protein